MAPDAPAPQPPTDAAPQDTPKSQRKDKPPVDPGKQAAQVALLAPIITIGVLHVVQASNDDRNALLLASLIAIIVVLIGIFGGIKALFSLRKQFRGTILAQALFGLFLSITFLAGIVVGAKPYIRSRITTKADIAAQQQLIGTWEAAPQGPKVIQRTWIQLNSDDSFQYRSFSNNSIANFSGTYLIRDNVLRLTVTHIIQGNSNLKPQLNIRLSISGPDEIVLGRGADLQVFHRINIPQGQTLDDIQNQYLAEAMNAESFPGWLGGLFWDQGQITILSYDDASPLSGLLASNFPQPFSIIQVIVFLQPDSTPVTINLDSFQAHAGETLIAKAMSQPQVAQTATVDRAAWIEKLTSETTIQAGQSCTDRFAFLTHGTDLTKVTHITMDINGEPFTFEGQYYSAEELAKQLDPESP